MFQEIYVKETFKEIFKSKNDKKIVDTVNGFFDSNLDYPRQMIERVWWRNLLYYIGEHWIEYVRTQQTFRRRSIPFYIPTPVSNEIRGYVNTMKSLLLSQKMIPRIWPNTNEREDIDASELGQKLLIWMESINDYELAQEKEKCIIWIIIAGPSFIRSFPEAGGGKVYFPDTEQMLSIGEVVAETIVPFNVYMDSSGDTLRKKRWIGIKSLKNREWIEDIYKVKVTKEENVSMTSDYQRRLMKLVGAVSPWKGQGLDTTTIGDIDEDLVVYKEVEFKPTSYDPYGRYIVTCGDKLLVNVPRMPIMAQDMNNWHYTLTDFHFYYVPGRFWSDTGVNDLISPQNTINEIDQTVAIARKGISRPRLITPGDIGLKKISEGGQGFLAVSYNPLLSGGKEPHFEPGTPLLPQIFNEREIQKIQIQDTAGDPKNILRGQPPSAQSSGIQVDILRETAERGHTPDIDRYHQSMNTVYKKRLLIAQEIYTEERMIKVAGRGNNIEVKTFKASDLRGNTDVRLELDSGLISTKSGQTDMLMKMISAGFFADTNIPASTKEDVFRRLGMTGFTDEVNLDVERAEKENAAIASGDFSEIFLSEPNPESGGIDADSNVLVNDQKFKYDNHQIHFDIHRKFIISSAFKELPERNQVVAYHHADVHNALNQAAQRNMLMQQVMAEKMKKPEKQEGIKAEAKEENAL